MKNSLIQKLKDMFRKEDNEEDYFLQTRGITRERLIRTMPPLVCMIRNGQLCDVYKSAVDCCKANEFLEDKINQVRKCINMHKTLYNFSFERLRIPEIEKRFNIKIDV